MTEEQRHRIRLFTGEQDPKECHCEHKLQGTGGVFMQSLGFLKCAACKGFQPIRKPIL